VAQPWPKVEVQQVEEVSMYAIFQSGGKQYEAKPGTVVKVEKIPGEVGDQVVMDQVLLMAEGDQIQVGQPTLQETVIQGRIVEQDRHKKIIVFKHKRRKDYRKKQGHRQFYTAVLIESISKASEQQPQSGPEADSAEIS
jgi:large subunit ribosomal protein L21